MLVKTAHQYVVDAESYEEAREKIERLFEDGVIADAMFDFDCYTENVREEDE